VLWLWSALSTSATNRGEQRGSRSVARYHRRQFHPRASIGDTVGGGGNGVNRAFIEAVQHPVQQLQSQACTNDPSSDITGVCITATQVNDECHAAQPIVNDADGNASTNSYAEEDEVMDISSPEQTFEDDDTYVPARGRIRRGGTIQTRIQPSRGLRNLQNYNDNWYYRRIRDQL
jgi:hypothetical protein